MCLPSTKWVPPALTAQATTWARGTPSEGDYARPSPRHTVDEPSPAMMKSIATVPVGGGVCGRAQRDALQAAVVIGDEGEARGVISRITRDPITCNDLTSELPRHALLMGLIYGTGGHRDPKSNRKAGYGRQEAIAQIADRQYDVDLPLAPRAVCAEAYTPLANK